MLPQRSRSRPLPSPHPPPSPMSQRRNPSWPARSAHPPPPPPPGVGIPGGPAPTRPTLHARAPGDDVPRPVPRRLGDGAACACGRPHAPLSSASRAAPCSAPMREEGRRSGPPRLHDSGPADLNCAAASEEDLALKEQLELYVVRAQDADPGVHKHALESMRQEICSATSSMTSVPKPLKFLRPHWNPQVLL
ncbi:hypothetical protein BS78_04G000300 [Paspalum vaginatum]|nr:hypothetical protein BS78_04G000300 [Paspalum vaginatum]